MRQIDEDKDVENLLQKFEAEQIALAYLITLS